MNEWQPDDRRVPPYRDADAAIIMKSEQRGLLWRFVGFAALIAVSVGAATLISLWNGPLG